MKGFFRKLFLAPQGLRYKLMIAFALMSIIPLLVLTYFVNSYIATKDSMFLAHISVAVILSVIIAWLGLLSAKRIIEPIIDMSIEARMIAQGDLEKKINIAHGDEIGALGESINVLARRIKENINELKDYREKTKEINLEIQKKMLTLSGLLQIGDLISSSADLDRVLNAVLEKLALFYEDGFSIAYLQKEKTDEFVMSGYINISDNELLNMTIKLGKDFLGEIAQRKKNVVMDNATPHNTNEYKFKTKYKLVNAVITPLYSGNTCRGILISGNNVKDFAYTNDDIDTIKVFGKQLSIATENHLLLKKAEMLSIKDDLTGMFNKIFIEIRLNEEIKRAMLYQRPCSLIVIDLDNFLDYRNRWGQLRVENALRKIANHLDGFLGPIDKAGRTGDDEFALLLPEKNKKAAFDIAEKVRKDIADLNLSDDPQDKITVSIGVSENPLDGSTSDDLFGKARACVKKAKTSGRNGVAI